MFSVKGSDKQQYGQGSSPKHNLEKPAGWCSCLRFCHPTLQTFARRGAAMQIWEGQAVFLPWLLTQAEMWYELLFAGEQPHHCSVYQGQQKPGRCASQDCFQIK